MWLRDVEHVFIRVQEQSGGGASEHLCVDGFDVIHPLHPLTSEKGRPCPLNYFFPFIRYRQNIDVPAMIVSAITSAKI